MKKLTEKSPSNGFARGPGSQLGTKSQSILELLRKGRPINRLDIEMKQGYPVERTLWRLCGLGYIAKEKLLVNQGCYSITRLGREALGESFCLPAPAYAPIINATMREPCIPSIHNTSRIGVARA